MARKTIKYCLHSPSCLLANLLYARHQNTIQIRESKAARKRARRIRAVEIPMKHDLSEPSISVIRVCKRRERS